MQKKLIAFDDDTIEMLQSYANEKYNGNASEAIRELVKMGLKLKKVKK